MHELVTKMEIDVPCVKLRSPPPSIVPAAKLWPSAGLHVLAW